MNKSLSFRITSTARTELSKTYRNVFYSPDRPLRVVALPIFLLRLILTKKQDLFCVYAFMSGMLGRQLLQNESNMYRNAE